ncbi:hypothetical protein FJY71_05160 [candidate division WOR-3 bacterium]|nr:hypothetical protein [candidate division WOR-3 bacterium]
MDSRDTALWTVWVEDRGTGHYFLNASRFSSGNWLSPESVTSDTADPYFVETAVDADLRPWVSWRNRWSRRQGDTWTTPALISTDTTGWENPGVAADPDSGVWAIWARGDARTDSISIHSSYCAADSWTPPSVVAEFPWWSVPYVPVITAPPRSKVRAVWTGAPAGGIGLYSATWSGDSWEDHGFIPGSWIGYRPSVCSDSVGGTWVTWLDGSGWDTVRYASHDGTGWVDTGLLGSGDGAGVFVYRGMLCCDNRGWIWALWVSSSGTSDSLDICVRYFDGDSWSDRCVITAAELNTTPRITAALDMVWVTWAQKESVGRHLLYYSHTLPAGIAGREERPAGIRVWPSIVRAGTALRVVGLEAGQAVQLLDATGREAGSRTSAARTSALAPGVYFVRIAGNGRPTCHKVLVGP